MIANVADREQMDAAAAKGVEKFGEINVACCNAGVCRLAPFEEMDDKTRDFHIDVNIKGVWNTCKAVIPYMLKQGDGERASGGGCLPESESSMSGTRSG